MNRTVEVMPLADLITVGVVTQSSNLSIFSAFQVSHDFAVNFDEDNPECAGK